MKRNNRDLSYTERDYEGLKNQLKILAEKYFPSTFRDFSDYSVETMLMEMIAYTGDVLNFYLDDRFKQNFIQYATDPESVFRLAKSRGYKPQTVSVSYGEVELSQLVEAVSDAQGGFIPDVNQCAVVKSGAYFSDSSQSTTYTLLDNCDMENYDRFELVEESGGVPTFFRVYKSVKVRSGEKKTKRIEITSTDPYPEFLVDSNVAFINSIVDSDGNTWYEVDFLAQDTIFENHDISDFSSEYEQFKEDTPFILKAKRVSRRFVTDHKSDGKCYIKFGSGIDNVDDSYKNLSAEDLLTTNSLSKLNESRTFTIDTFLQGDSFGLRPSNTILTVEYIRSRGEEETARSGSVNFIVNITPTFSEVVPELIKNSFEVNNPKPILGGSFNNIEKIRNESYEAFYTQRRCVTVKDYILRSKLMPSKFGKIEKVFVERNDRGGYKSVNIYPLSIDSEGNFVSCNDATKQNLMSYLKEFKIASDRINIFDPYIINIGIKFSFLSKKGFDKDQVLLNISKKVEEYFNRDKIELNQPILLGDLIQYMDSAEGVIMVSDVQIINKYDSNEGYSPVIFDTSVNGENFDTKKKILYPPLDIGIFELKKPLVDIIGKPL